MSGNGDQVAVLLFWGGEITKNGYLGSVDYSEPPKTMCFLNRRGDHKALESKVRAAMNTPRSPTNEWGTNPIALFGKYPNTVPGGKVVFIPIPLTNDRSWRWFLDAALASDQEPLHVYVLPGKGCERPTPPLPLLRGDKRRPAWKTGDATMKIYVKTLTGKRILLEVDWWDTIDEVKEQILN